VQFGRATVHRVFEFGLEMRTGIFPQTEAGAWHEHADLLAPHFFNPDSGQWRAAMQSWVIEVDGLTVVVDTGVGNDRDRPHMPPLDHLHTDFLANLSAAGIDRAGVDVVINTHIHTDHVGWNTMLADGDWVPTFPNARYLMPAADYRYFDPDNDAAKAPARTDEEQARLDGSRIVFSDSVIPVSDQIEQYAGDYQLSDSLWLRPAAGHTPGSSVVWLDAGEQAVFVGDLTHSPLQLVRPDDFCAFDLDYAQAAASRRRVFTEAARAGAAVLPAHYPGPGGAHLMRTGDGFAVDRWLDYPPI
jgi:glyoxylase-like metal-dependent hydrolase (beta-lactamase superfamily II)